ncbi:MAG: hypothetical protein C3F08_00695 [Candidatus Methylomirabilota bacterium]|nr:MAG: hypothetical protein C3F08_00695 [candidate division NC10 bacterium]
MPLKIHLTLKSSNQKTGEIPVSTSSADTCPPSCPLRRCGCYALSGPVFLHWRAVSEGRRGSDWGEFCSQVAALPEGQLWRHNQAGDLPGANGVIDKKLVCQLVEANRGRRGFTYTHYPMTKRNAAVVAHANEHGFTVNLSANNLTHADELADLDVGPVVTLVPEGSPSRTVTPAGRKVILCPAQDSVAISCASCGICARHHRGFVVAFKPHGTQRRQANSIAEA